MKSMMLMVAGCVLVSAAAGAAEGTGAIRKVDAEKGLIYAVVGGQTVTLKADADLKVTDAEGKELAGGLKALAAGSRAEFTFELENRVRVVKEIKLTAAKDVAKSPGRKTAGEAAGGGKQVTLDGTWQGYVVRGKGEGPNDNATHLQVQVQGNRIVAFNLDDRKPQGQGMLRMDAGHNILDAMGDVVGAGTGRNYPGIFQVEGDTWKWCVDSQGRTRPTELVSRKSQYLLILKKQAATEQ